MKAVQNLFDELVLKVSTSSENRHRLLLVIIISLGFALRLHGLLVGEGFREFSIKDEVTAYEFALAFLAGETHTWYLGQPAFLDGLAPGPMWTLFWVLLYKLGAGAPDGAMFWMLTVNTFVIYLVYRFSRTLLGRDYALLTALLYATGAWPMFYSTILWNPVPMALLGVLLFIALWQSTQKERSRSIFLVCLISAIIPQFHMIGLFYYPAILLILYLSPVKLNVKWFVSGVIAGTFVYLPYLIGDMLNNWENTINMFGERLSGSFGVGKIITTPIGVLSNQVARWTGYDFESYREFGDNYFGSYILLVGVNLVSIIISLIFVASILRKAFSVMRGNWLSPGRIYAKYPAYLFVGIFLVIPPLLFLLTRHNYGSRYTIIIFPLLFLLPAFFLSELKNVKIKNIFRFVLSCMIIFNCYLYLVFNLHISNRIELAEYYAPSFRKMEDTRQQVRKKVGAKGVIKIVNQDYITNTTEDMYTGGVALAHYINISEKYSPHDVMPEKEITLYLAHIDDSLPENATIVYQTNGMVIFKRNIGNDK